MKHLELVFFVTLGLIASTALMYELCFLLYKKPYWHVSIPKFGITWLVWNIIILSAILGWFWR